MMRSAGATSRRGTRAQYDTYLQRRPPLPLLEPCRSDVAAQLAIVGRSPPRWRRARRRPKSRASARPDSSSPGNLSRVHDPTIIRVDEQLFRLRDRHSARDETGLVPVRVSSDLVH